ncbi:TrbM/KikA/MpfK family conjugal transfer protein [Campylobacter jejuni]
MKNFIFGAKKDTLMLATILLTRNAFAGDELTGDTKLACEVILCLSSATRPAECGASLARYFAIYFKKPWKTIDARKSFLNLCPIQNGTNVEDLVLKNLVDDVLPSGNPDECMPNYLNSQIQRKSHKVNLFGGIDYRVNPNMPGFCYTLINHQYTDYKMPKYACTREWYSSLEWKLIAKLEDISEKDYQSLPENDRYIMPWSCGDRDCYKYYKKIPFSKECWIY